jgi:hypothetical protein
MRLMHKVALILVVAVTFAGCLSTRAPGKFADRELDYAEEIDVVRRSEWGWKKAENPLPEHSISKITIHHGGVAFGEDRELTDVQFESLAKLTAFLSAEYSVELPHIRSHKDYAPGETDCPGANIYQYLEDGSLLRRVAQIIN